MSSDQERVQKDQAKALLQEAGFRWRFSSHDSDRDVWVRDAAGVNVQVSFVGSRFTLRASLASLPAVLTVFGGPQEPPGRTPPTHRAQQEQARQRIEAAGFRLWEHGDGDEWIKTVDGDSVLISLVGRRFEVTSAVSRLSALLVALRDN